MGLSVYDGCGDNPCKEKGSVQQGIDEAQKNISQFLKYYYQRVPGRVSTRHWRKSHK